MNTSKFFLIILSLFVVLPGFSRQLAAGLHFKEPLVLKEKTLTNDYQATLAYRELLEKWGKLSFSPWQGVIVSHNFVFSGNLCVQFSPLVWSDGDQTTQVFAFIPRGIGDDILGPQKVPP